MANEIKKCTIISGAPCDNYDFIKQNIDLSSYIICADSGYKVALAIGIMPNLIVGDFDSSDKPNLDCEIITLNSEKADTDTFHCVKLAVDKGFNCIIIFNALGDRFDHSYSNVLCLDYCRKNGVKCFILNDKNRLSLIESKTSFKKEYNNFSLFAFLDECRGVTIKGAYYTAGFYNKDKLDMMPYDQFAQSNFVNADYCEIDLESGVLLLVESND